MRWPMKNGEQEKKKKAGTMGSGVGGKENARGAGKKKEAGLGKWTNLQRSNGRSGKNQKHSPHGIQGKNATARHTRRGKGGGERVDENRVGKKGGGVEASEGGTARKPVKSKA